MIFRFIFSQVVHDVITQQGRDKIVAKINLSRFFLMWFIQISGQQWRLDFESRNWLKYAALGSIEDKTIV